jgi:hypothetical protein
MCFAFKASVSVKRIGAFLQTEDIDSRNVSHDLNTGESETEKRT